MNKIKKYAGVAVLSSMIVGSVHASALTEGFYELNVLSHLVLNTAVLGLDGYSIIKDTEHLSGAIDEFKLLSMDITG